MLNTPAFSERVTAPAAPCNSHSVYFSFFGGVGGFSFETASPVLFQCGWCFLFFFDGGGQVTSLLFMFKKSRRLQQTMRANPSMDRKIRICCGVFFLCYVFSLFFYLCRQKIHRGSQSGIKRGEGGNVSSPGMTLERSRVFFGSFVEKEFLSAPCF